MLRFIVTVAHHEQAPPPIGFATVEKILPPISLYGRMEVLKKSFLLWQSAHENVKELI
jgi:hypothetical protein